MSHMVSSVTKQVETAIRTDYCRSQWGTPVSHISREKDKADFHSFLKKASGFTSVLVIKITSKQKAKRKKSHWLVALNFPPLFPTLWQISEDHQGKY